MNGANKGPEDPAQVSSARTDSELAAREQALQKLSRADLEALSPALDPAETLLVPKLIQALKDSAARRESATQLETRLRVLGEATLRLALLLAARIR